MTKKINDMTMTDLILLKSIFNKELHEAISSKHTLDILSIMLVEYQNDIQLHAIADYSFDTEFIHAEHEREIKEGDFKWTL